MRILQKLDWLDPLFVASQIPEDEESWALLYSGMKGNSSGRFSFLALNIKEEVTGSFTDFAEKLSSNNNIYDNAWFGYFGYGLKNQLEKLTTDSPSYINSDDLWFAKFATIIVFDHENHNVQIWGENEDEYYSSLIKFTGNIKSTPQRTAARTATLRSNMTRAEYLEKVSYIKEAIKNGDIYQANLTRKFFGEIEDDVSPFAIFQKLCAISPAPYSAFIKNGDLHIISSSPERFLHIDSKGNANIRPIKGSIARSSDKIKDEDAITQLSASEKDRAENLMIVDLSRNDLAKNCKTGSVKVDELFSIETYATVHHMVSSVTGIKNDRASTLELIKGCFPPGSMTGTPKIKAMEICSKLENMKRGIYSGAIGWMGGNGSADLAVVIRTIILKGNKFEFQVGGAIVNDSTPEKEFAETILKATGVAAALGIELCALEKL